MSYWIFKVNPEIYDIDSRLKVPNPVTYWRVRFYRKEIQMGDFAFIWRAGEPRGIIGVMKITSDLYFLPYNDQDPEFTGEYKVDVLFVLRFPSQTLENHFLKGIAGLENMSVFHGYQAKTNFPVTDREGKIIVNLIYQKFPNFPKIQGL